MRDAWLKLVDCVLRPARPRLAACLRERDFHREAQRVIAEGRARALAHCERQIEEERGAVLAARDGVIPSRMTDLERRWRQLSRPDPDGGLMDLWARIAPVSFLDRKLWRDSDPSARVEVATALAADVEGVGAAEAAVIALRAALAAWGTPLGPCVRFRLLGADADCVTPLLAEPHRAALEAVAGRYAGPVILERTEHLGRDVREALRVRFPERPLLGQALAHAAVVDGLLRAAAFGDRPNPVAALCALWGTGYALAAIEPDGVTLELPRLS
jgi:hypothetical protein